MVLNREKREAKSKGRWHKAPFISYADLECLIEKINGCKNNPENLSTTKVSKHIPPGF